MEKRALRTNSVLFSNKTNKKFDFTLSAIFVSTALIIFIVATWGNIFNIKPHVFGMSFELACAGMGVWIGILFLLWSRYRGKLDPFEPPAWISLNVYIQVVLNVWLLQRNRFPEIPWIRTRLEIVAPQAILLFSVGLTVLWFGYAWFYKYMAKKQSKPAATTSQINTTITFLIWLVGFLIGIYGTLAGVGSYLGTAAVAGFAWDNYFYFVRIIASAAEAALVIKVFRTPSILGWIWFVFMVSSVLLLSLVNGSKGFALNLLWLVIYVYYARGKFPIKWLATGFVLVILLVPVVNEYRDILIDINLGRGVGFFNRIDALQQAVQSAVSKPIGNLITSTSDTFKIRQGSLMDITSSVLVLHPNTLPFVGKEMGGLLFPQLIPRLFWPNKPTDRPEIYNITSKYTGATTEYSYSDIGLFADSYRTAGWVGLIVWFLILSAFLVYLYLQGPESNNQAGIVFYIVMITQIIRYDADLLSTFLRILQFAPLLWIVIFKIMYRKPIQRNPLEPLI